MPVSLLLDFTGVVSKPSRLTGNGPGQYALVKLDEEVDGVRYASISMNTRNRSNVLSQIGGQFREGVRVKGSGTRGPEAISASFIELIPN